MENMNEYTRKNIQILEDELELITRSEKAQEQSILRNGIISLPAGLTAESIDPDSTNFGQPAIVVGGVTIHGPQELLDEVKLIEFSKPIDYSERKRVLRQKIDFLKENMVD